MNLNQVTVPSANVARSVDFYRKLGLIQIVEDLPKYARFLCPDGGSTFSVHLAAHSAPEDGVASFGHTGSEISVYFECDDLDQRVESLKREGLVFETDPIDQEWLWREAYLRDPDGNLICLFHAGENRLNPPWRINPSTS